MRDIFNRLKTILGTEKHTAEDSNKESQNAKSFEQFIVEMPNFSLDSLIGKELQEKIDFVKSTNKKLIIENYKASPETIANLQHLQNEVLKECGFDTLKTFTDAFDYGDRAIAKAELNDSVGAIADFNKAILINPDYENAYLWRGEEKYKLGDFEGAFKDFNFVLKINPDNSDALSNIKKLNFPKST